ncbi:MAG: DUF1846 domain-containing protein [Candidatus Saccharibacteria bacterium]
MSRFPEQDTRALRFEQPTDMGVNVIERSITDEKLVAKACQAEILRRVQRYKQEIAAGNEMPETLSRTLTYNGGIQLEAI